MNIRLVAYAFLLATLVILNQPATAANSPDGSMLFPGTSGSLTTSAGTWTFSTTTGSGGNDILLNGTWVNARGVELIVGNGGQMYDFSASSHWYHWNGSSFGSALSSTPFPISANGSSMTPGGSVDLVTIQGIWAFSTSSGSGGNLVLLNGVQAGNGSAVFALIDNGGQVYQKNNAGNWYVWSTAAVPPAWAWNSTTDPTVNAFRPYCSSAVIVGLQWPAVSGASTYNISRNGSPIETGTELLFYTDQGVKASTSYSYVLTALNSSGGTVSTQNLSVKTPAATATGDPPYCPSNVIAGMTWNWSTGINQQNSSDLWDSTWGADGNTYLFFGDGWGFFGPNSSGGTSFGISELTLSAPPSGTAPVLTTSNAVNVYGGYNATHPSTINGKASSLIAINSDYYAIGSVYQSGDSGGPGGAPPHVEIEYSLGDAYSWTSNYSNWIFCNNATPANAFCPGSFVEFGAGNSGAIDNYVYIYGTTKQTEVGTSPNSYLARVPNNEILTKSAYQLFGGLDSNGNPIWNTPNSTWSNMQPVFTDPGPNPLNIGAPVYDPGLNRYIAVGLGNFVNQAAFYESPNPWGPWRSIGYYNSTPTSGGWGNLGDASFTNGHGDSIGINFMNKWTSSDGKTMWAVFSSDGTAGNAGDLVPLRGQSMDSFSLVSVTLSQF